MRIAVAYTDQGAIDVDICPFCTGPHSHPIRHKDDLDAKSFGIFVAGCSKPGAMRKYHAVNGAYVVLPSGLIDAAEEHAEKR